MLGLVIYIGINELPRPSGAEYKACRNMRVWQGEDFGFSAGFLPGQELAGWLGVAGLSAFARS